MGMNQTTNLPEQASESYSPAIQTSGKARSSWKARRKAIAVLLGLQLLLAVLALSVWVWTPDRPGLPPLPAGTAPLAGSGATYESALPLAQTQADAWLPGAILLNASMQVDWPWSVPSGSPTSLPGTGWLTYSFVAPWDPPGRPPGAARATLPLVAPGAPAGAPSRGGGPRRGHRATDRGGRDRGDGRLGAVSRVPPASATGGDRLDRGHLARRGGRRYGLPSRLS